MTEAEGKRAKAMMTPRLVLSPLSNRVYVLTRYKVTPGTRPGTELLEATGPRFDVTDDFEVVVKQMKRRKKAR